MKTLLLVRIIFIFTVLLLLLNCYCNALTLIGQPQFQFRTLAIQGQDFNAAVFTLNFNESIYVRDINGHVQLYSNYTGFTEVGGSSSSSSSSSSNGGGGPTCMPNVLNAAGIIQLHYNGITVESYGNFQGQNGPPEFVLLMPPSADPVNSFLNMLGCNPNFISEPYFTTNLTAVYFLDNLGFTETQFLSYKPNITLQGGTVDSQYNPAPNGRVLVNVANHTIPITSNPVITQTTTIPCDHIGLSQYVSSINSFITIGSQSITSSQFQNLQFELAGFENRVAWTSCSDYALSLLHFQTTSLTITGVESCISPSGTLQYAMDPCCNQTITPTQCCAPHSVTQSFQLPINVTSTVATTCLNPTITQSVLIDFANTLEQADTLSFLSNTVSSDAQQLLRDQLSAFQSTCQTLVFKQACKLNTDCTYTGICNQNSGTCQLNFDQQTKALVSCFLDEMLPQMIFELCALWDIPYSTDKSVLLTTFLPQFESRILSNGCVGQSAQQFSSNETSCLSQMTCNNNGMNGIPITTQQECVGTATTLVQGTSFCGQSFGNSNINQQTRWARCQLSDIENAIACNKTGYSTWIPTENACIMSNSSILLPQPTTGTSGLTSSICFASVNNDQICQLAYTQWRTQQLAGLNTSSLAFAEAQFQPFWDNTCSQDICFSNTTQQACNTYQQYLWSIDSPLADTIGYISQYSICVANNWNSEGGLNASYCHSTYNMSYHRGVSYIPGAWDSVTACSTLGQCSSSNLNNIPVTLEQCQTQPDCTLPCQRCSTYMQNPITLQEATVCYNASITTQNGCNVIGGNWNNQNDVNLCVSNAVPCPVGFEVLACSNSNSLTETQCNYQAAHSAAAQFLGCQWNSYIECRTSQECEAQGQCNDQEFEQCTNNNPGEQPVCTYSACVQPWQYDINGNQIQCQQQSGNNNNNNIYSQLGCIQSNITTQQACVSKGYLWKTKATNATQCANQGSACFLPNNPWNGYFLNPQLSASCQSCGGTTKHLYTYITGDFIESEIQSLVWVQRNWTTVNNWELTINYNKLQNNVINPVLNSIIARNQVNYIAATRLASAPLLQFIINNCLSNNDSLSAVSELVLNNLCLLNPGQDKNTCGPITYNNAHSSSSTQLPIYTVLGSIHEAKANALLAAGNHNGGNNNRRLLSSSGSNTNYDLIQNQYNVTVGNIIGDGVIISYVNTTAPTLCLPHSSNPPVESASFTVPGVIVETTVIPVQPLTVPIIIQGLSYCINVTTTGTYFPALIQPNWQTYRGVLLSSSTGVAASSSSSSSDWWSDSTNIIIVVCASVGGVIVVILFVVLFERIFCKKGSNYASV